MRVQDREPISLASGRFKNLSERSGLQQELRRQYEKPCEVRGRAELRKQSAIRKARLTGQG
jgi:ribosomal protein S21